MRKIYLIIFISVLFVNCGNSLTGRNNIRGSSYKTEKKQSYILEKESDKNYGQIIPKNLNISTLKTIGSLFSTYLLANFFPITSEGALLSPDYKLLRSNNDRHLLEIIESEAFYRNFTIETLLFKNFVNEFPVLELEDEKEEYIHFEFSADLTVLNDSSMGICESRTIESPLLNMCYVPMISALD